MLYLFCNAHANLGAASKINIIVPFFVVVNFKTWNCDQVKMLDLEEASKRWTEFKIKKPKNIAFEFKGILTQKEHWIKDQYHLQLLVELYWNLEI